MTGYQRRDEGYPGHGHRDDHPDDGHGGRSGRASARTRYRPDVAGGPRAPRPARRRDTTGGAEGNERLTAATGAVLLVLFAAEGVTILAVRQLLTFHFFIGMLLIGPVMLKAGSTIYRFVRYYSGVPDYRRKGPPAPLLRLLGPFVLATSLAVIGTGVILGYAGSNASFWLFLHKASFVLWFGVMTIHVLVYTWRLPRLVGADLRGRAGRRGVPDPGGAGWPAGQMAAADRVGAGRAATRRAHRAARRCVAGPAHDVRRRLRPSRAVSPSRPATPGPGTPRDEHSAG